MKENKENLEIKENLERYALIAYSFYHLCIFISSVYRGWDAWYSIIIFAALFVSWLVNLLKVRSRHFQAGADVAMIMVSEFVYAMNTEDMGTMIVSFLSVAIIAGLYGYMDILSIPLATLILITGIHFFDIFSAGYAMDEILPDIFLLASVLLAMFVIMFWVARWNDTYRQLMKVISELRQAEQSKDDFLANVSHEIRTPINTISGMSEILLQEENPVKLKEDIQMIRLAGRNLMRVVSDILDFSELQSGELEIVEEAYDVTSCVNDLVNMCNAIKQDKKLELVVDLDCGVPRSLLGDEKKIRRVVLNLVSNAIKFTNEGGVGVSIGFRREYYGINLVITVSDSGIGMEQKSVEKLFTTYNQVDSSRRRQNGGVGIGLAIAQMIVHNMGGVINVKSRLSKGTIVKVTIPQKILEEGSIAQFHYPDSVRLICYLDMEQIEKRGVRDTYTDMIRHMIAQLGVYGRISRNLMELKRRVEQEKFSHVFVGVNEYEQDHGYFDELADRMHVVVIIDRGDEKRLKSAELFRLYKPFYILPVISILNSTTDVARTKVPGRKKNFVAPEARVLVVDDNLMNIRVIEGLLARYQIQVTSALSGKDGIERIKDRCYDFVFMDHMMPEMDGVETLHRIRKLGGKYCETVPVVALTANAIAGARKMLLAEGFSDFLEKPVESSVLERMLLRILPKEKIIMVDEAQEELPEEMAQAPHAADMPETPETPQPGQQPGTMCVGDLDTSQGMLYCGGEENYIAILREYAVKGEENWKPVEELYSRQDWKNYVIAVHAVKSTMLTIGAKKLSEMAKALELEGKKDNTEYIHAHHEEMMTEYKRVIGEITAFFHVPDDAAEKTEGVDLPELPEEEFEAFAIAFEDAMYELDGEKMLEILCSLEKHTYHGTPLEQQLVPIRHKVEMTDLMSAVEALLQMKDRLKNKR